MKGEILGKEKNIHNWYIQGYDYMCIVYNWECKYTKCNI